MLQIARLAPRLLGESSALVRACLEQQITAEGGFRDRGGASDLYYTVFGLEGLSALGVELPAATAGPYLDRFGDGEALDLVHLACLARCRAMIPAAAGWSSEALLARLERFRAADGGYHPTPGAAHGTAYHAFLALGAYEDLRAVIPRPEALRASVHGLRAADGGFANEPQRPAGATSATAAAVMVLRHLDADIPGAVSDWLLTHAHLDGGFVATKATPAPDLLSTATALHALTALHANIDPIRERCLDFIDTLWTSRGGFYGHWADDEVDAEYTYYGLLALGHLAL